MTAIWMRARSELRARWLSITSLAVIAGVIGGIVIAAAAGARRTDTAYSRFFEAKSGLDLEIDTHAKTFSEAAPAGWDRGRAEHVQAARREHPPRDLPDAGLRPSAS